MFIISKRFISKINYHSRSKKSDLKDKTAGISSTTKDALGTEVTNAAASRENDDNLILSLNLNLSAVTMETKSILDRYRLSFNTSSSHYIRGTCASTKFWDKLSPQSRDKSDSLKYAIHVYFSIYMRDFNFII